MSAPKRCWWCNELWNAHDPRCNVPALLQKLTLQLKPQPVEPRRVPNTNGAHP